MKQKLTPAQRLIVAADFKPDPKTTQGKNWVRAEVLALALALKGTGVYLKVNSALRANGYDLIQEIQRMGLKVFADLKLNDISETMAIDGALLRQVKPDIVTVMCSAGVGALSALKKELPETEVLGVTVLTSLKEGDTKEMFHETVQGAIRNFALVGEGAGLDGLICAPTDIPVIRGVVERKMTLNTPGIRPLWSLVPGDDQNPDRIMTPEKAIKAGADRIVVGRPVTKAINARAAVLKLLEEIAAVT